MSYMMAGISLFTMFSSLYGAHQKRQLGIAGANETLTQTAENAIAGKMTKQLKTKEFYRGVGQIRKQGAYAKSMLNLKGEKKRAKNFVQRASRGVKMQSGTPLDLSVEDAMLKEYAMGMKENETFATLDNMNHSFHDWSTVHDWQQKIMLRRGKKKAELQRKGVDVQAFGDVTSGLTQAGLYGSKGTWSLPKGGGSTYTPRFTSPSGP